jgi:hypothetical protein
VAPKYRVAVSVLLNGMTAIISVEIRTVGPLIRGFTAELNEQDVYIYITVTGF